MDYCISTHLILGENLSVNYISYPGIRYMFLIDPGLTFFLKKNCRIKCYALNRPSKSILFPNKICFWASHRPTKIVYLAHLKVWGRRHNRDSMQSKPNKSVQSKIISKYRLPKLSAVLITFLDCVDVVGHTFLIIIQNLLISALINIISLYVFIMAADVYQLPVN